MTKIFVPVIVNEKAELFELSVTERNDARSKKAGLLLKNEYFPQYVDVFKSKFSDLHHNVNFISQSDTRFDVFTSATYSARLGIYLALEQYINQRKFKEEWDGVVVTGNLNSENGNLTDIDQVEKKYEALIDYTKNLSGKYLFIYVSNSLIHLKESETIKISFFTSTQSIFLLKANIFDSVFDDEQQNTINRILEINQNHPYFEHAEFQTVIADSEKNGWNGCCICGDSNTGKSVFAFNFCKYLMAINKIYKPIWIQLEDTDLMLYKYEKINPIEELIARYFNTEVLGYKDLNNILQKQKYILVIDTKNVIYDSVLNNFIIEFIKKVEVKIPVILTAIKDVSNVDDYYLKRYFLTSLSETECCKLLNFAINDYNLDIQENNDDYAILKRIVYNKCCSTPGYIYKLARILKIETIQSLAKRIEMNNVSEIESEYLNYTLEHLPFVEKALLWSFVWQYQFEDQFELKRTICIEDGNNIDNKISSSKDKWLVKIGNMPECVEKFYNHGLIKLKYDREYYITFEKEVYLFLLKNYEMFKRCRLKGVRFFAKKTLMLSYLYDNCYSFIIYNRFHDFYVFLGKAIGAGCNYWHLELMARLMIIYDWPKVYIIEYFDYLKKQHYDVTKLLWFESEEGFKLSDLLIKYCKDADFVAYIQETSELTDEYLNKIQNNSKYYRKDKKPFSERAKKALIKVIMKPILIVAKAVSEKNGDNKSELLSSILSEWDDL